MNAEAITAFSGVAVAVTGLLGILYKMWHDHTTLAQSQQVLTQQVLTVIEKNAIASTELRNAVHANTEITKTFKDEFSNILIKMVKK